jgi:hypothetical protein
MRKFEIAAHCPMPGKDWPLMAEMQPPVNGNHR